jgi:hypothetical protein
MRRLLPLVVLVPLVMFSLFRRDLPVNSPPDKPLPFTDTTTLYLAIAHDKEPLLWGSAFVITDTAGKNHLLTAANALKDEAEWQSAKSAVLDRMTGTDREVASSAGRPVYIGRRYTRGDSTADLVVWPLADGAKVKPLKLAAEDPKPKDWVWVVASEQGESMRAFRFQVVRVHGGDITLDNYDYAKTRFLNGAPMVNAAGEVVGIVLADQDSLKLIAGGVSGIRKRLTEAGVSVP